MNHRSPRILVLVLAAAMAASACGGRAPKTRDAAAGIDSQTKARVAESLLNAGRVTEALAAIDEAIEMEPEQARLRYFRGSILFRTGRYAEAEPEFLRALELDP